MHTPRVQVEVTKDWRTDAYNARWTVYDQREVPIATGHETYGPLWEASQVEQLVGSQVAALVAVWLSQAPYEDLNYVYRDPGKAPAHSPEV